MEGDVYAIRLARTSHSTPDDQPPSLSLPIPSQRTESEPNGTRIRKRIACGSCLLRFPLMRRLLDRFGRYTEVLNFFFVKRYYILVNPFFLTPHSPLGLWSVFPPSSNKGMLSFTTVSTYDIDWYQSQCKKASILIALSDCNTKGKNARIGVTNMILKASEP